MVVKEVDVKRVVKDLLMPLREGEMVEMTAAKGEKKAYRARKKGGMKEGGVEAELDEMLVEGMARELEDTRVEDGMDE
jgi:hypothetical protein